MLLTGTMHESGSTSTELCSGYRYSYSCSIGNGNYIDESNERQVYSLTVTWNGENITSGDLSQSSNNGDHVYRFYLHMGNVMRNHSCTITGESL